jgi:hypothetical protein
MRALVVCIAMFFAQCATAAVTINIIETGGHVEVVLSGNLNLGATLGLVGPSFGHDKYNASAGLVGFTQGDTEYYVVDVGWTPFGPGGTGTWFSSSGDAFTMYTRSNVGVPTGYISGNALSATATAASATLAALGFTVGTYVTTLTNGQITDTVTVIVGEAVPPTYSVGGTVSGLTGSVTLQNNVGDDIIKTTNDGFTFTAQAEGSDYVVTVSSQPSGQTCSVGNGSGTNITANITNVTVTCVTDEVPTYTVGGTVSGLTGSVTLQNNSSDDIIKTTNDGFTFPAQAGGTDYAVTVSSQPTGQTCSVTNDSGTNITADVTNVSVACIDDVVAPPPVPMVPVPTLSEWALILLTMLLGLMVFANRRRLF